MEKIVDLAAVAYRITGCRHRAVGDFVPLGRGHLFRSFDRQEDGVQDAGLARGLNIVTDPAGGYRAVDFSGDLLREGHLAEFASPGFSDGVLVDIEVTDPEEFSATFGIDLSAPKVEAPLSRLLAIEPSLEPHLTIDTVAMTHSHGQCWRLTIVASSMDEASFMAELRKTFLELWGGADGFPRSRAGAIFEACLGSNANPSPDLCGFQILNWGPAPDPIADEAPEVTVYEMQF